MNHPKNALKEAQRQSATSHHPGVRKVEKGQFEEPIGYTTQLKSLFHIHSYPSFKNLPLSLISPKAKLSLYIKIYIKMIQMIHSTWWFRFPNYPIRSRCSGSMTEPPSLYAWYLGENPTKISTSTGGNNAENAENAARNFSRTPFVGRADPNLTEKLPLQTCLRLKT